jgi:putative oxidoreductase
MNIGALAVRGTIGPLFVGHGAQKLWGKFGGHGPDGTGAYFESIGIRPGRRNAIAAGAAEVAGGALLTLGALTPVAATLLTSVMVTAIRKVHGEHGPWITENGYEYNVSVIAVVTGLADRGPGTPSVDDVLFPRMRGPAWTIGSLAAGIVGSFLVTEVFARRGADTHRTAEGEDAVEPEAAPAV